MSFRMHGAAFDLPDPIQVKFFRSIQVFESHAFDHILDPYEPWHLVVNNDLLAECNSYRHAPCKKGGRIPVKLLERLYREVVRVLEQALREAAEEPLFARCLVAPAYDGGSGAEEEYRYFLISRIGLSISIEGTTLKTASFEVKYSPEEEYTVSLSELYSDQFEIEKFRATRTKYFDFKYDRWVVQREPEFFSPDNWRTLKNPHLLSDKSVRIGAGKEDRKLVKKPPPAPSSPRWDNTHWHKQLDDALRRISESE